MIQVKNNKTIAKLSQKSLQANRTRNLIAVFAVALTTMLFMSLFTIAGTMLHSFEQATFRQVGSNGHGGFKHLTTQQKETLERDPIIKEVGSRLMLGFGSGDAFRKVHAEFSYMEPNYIKHAFCEPEYGRVPKEGTKELACDTRILKCLGIEPKIGAKVTASFTVGGAKRTQITDTFTLSGWWEYDPAAMASMAIVSKSYAQQIVKQHPNNSEDDTDYTGLWDMDILLDSSMHIGEDLVKILQNNGYQADDASKENYIGTGVNWAYAGAQLSANIDPETLAGGVLLVLVIMFTGYLVIYNIFQISVSGDIRFYGLLKTIGTTSRQIKRIVRRQALALSAIGIPLGLAAGAFAGTVLAPDVMASFTIRKAYPVMQPWFFVVSTGFSLVTVLISCAKPGQMAAKVSPVEAVRYTDAPTGKKQKKKGKSGGRPFAMARANLGRNRKKTILTVLSMMLAVVLLQGTYTFAGGFDMDKYLEKWVVSDFILGNASHFNSAAAPDPFQFPSVPEEDIQNVRQTGNLTQSGRIYGHNGSVSSYVTEDTYAALWRDYFQSTDYEEMLAMQERNTDGDVNAPVSLYGMESFPMDQLKVIDGNISDVYDPSKKAVAAVYLTDDYGKPIEESHWAKPGDQVTLHYVYEWEYIDDETGAKISEEDLPDYDRPVTEKEVKSADITYEVAACVTMKYAMTYRRFGDFQYVLDAQTFQKDSKTSDVLLYLFDTEKETNAQMAQWLSDYTTKENADLDFESKQKWVREFEQYRNMFLLLGGLLSAVVGMVGVLNFFNAVLTSVYARRREFAMLQAVGMTGKQLKRMLIYEGLLYGAASVLLAALSCVLLAPVAGGAVSGIWFFTFRFLPLPFFVAIPVFALAGAVLPLLCYKKAARQTIVERLRENG